MPDDLDFIHVYHPAAEPSARTLLLLHGTGATEHDLVPLARQLAPDAHLLSPRGKVLEGGMPRFFRRLAPGVLDVEDLKARAGELADFVGSAAETYGFDPARVTAFGFSNGANAAAAMLLTRPGVLAGAVLGRAMVPFEPEGVAPTETHPRVLLLAGRQDPYSRSPVTERLAEILEDAGAQVEVAWEDAGHGLTPGDLASARAWLDRHKGVRV